MITLGWCLQILVIALLGVISACGLPNVPEISDDRYKSLNYRDETEALSADPRKPVREDGLGSLLLKNLRFRDLPPLYRQIQPMTWMLGGAKATDRGRRWSILNSPDREQGKVSKRSNMSVHQLAAILSNLKVRNAEDDVKLQSLRFGKR